MNNILDSGELTEKERECIGQIDSFIGSLNGKDGALIAVLQKAQEFLGYLPPGIQLHIAQKLGVTPAKVYGVVTFYSNFTMERRGTYEISVCLGTACFVRGAQDILNEFEKILGIKKGEVTSDGMFSLDSLRCVGACGLAPVVMVNGKVYGNVSAGSVIGIIDEYRSLNEVTESA